MLIVVVIGQFGITPKNNCFYGRGRAAVVAIVTADYGVSQTTAPMPNVARLRPNRRSR